MSLDAYGWTTDWSDTHPIDAPIARIIKEFQHIYHIVTDTDRSEAIVTGQFRHHVNHKADYPVVGDWVTVSGPHPDGRYHIEGIIPRRNHLSRVHKHYNHEEQVLVSNVDIAFIMVSLDGYRQDNENRLNRFIQLVTKARITPVILCNKTDLSTTVSDTIADIKRWVNPYDVLPIQAKFNQGIAAIHQRLIPQQTAIVLGVSGVGKSTLINQLLNQDVQTVRDVRVKDKKGMHTTRNRELFLLPNGSMIIDTPGIKSLEVWQDDTGQSSISEHDSRFDQIRELALHCKFSNCTHQHEPHCAVKAAVESGQLDVSIVQLFLKHI